MVNLRTNYPSLQEEGDLFKAFIAQCPADQLRQRSDSSLLTGVEAESLHQFLQIDSKILQNTTRTITCSSGTSALFLLLSVLQNTHGKIGVEDFTYNGLLNAARSLSLKCAPLECDKEGPLPEAIAEALGGGIRLFYLQPTIHNPTNRVMGEARRKLIAGLLQNTGALLIEDDAYRFLHPAAPPRFLELLPTQTISIISLSKPFHSFTQTCFLLYPNNSLPGLDAMVRLTGNDTPYLMRRFSFYLLKKGYVDTLIKKKRELAVSRKQGIEALLSPLTFETFPTSFHLWIHLPEGADAMTITEALRKQEILVAGGEEYSPTDNTSFIRIALSAEDDDRKRYSALKAIRDLLLS